MKNPSKTIPSKRLTLREESLAENMKLGLEQQQEQMDFIFSVLHQHGINGRLWMQEYFAACNVNGKLAQQEVEKFLPWNLPSEAKQRLSKDCNFSYGNAQFVQTNDGTTYHIQMDGTRIKINIGDMTFDEFEKLIS